MTVELGIELMERLPDHNEKYLLQESCRLLGIDPSEGTLRNIHSYLLDPCGHAARRLADGLRHYPVDQFDGDFCGRTFRQTSPWGGRGGFGNDTR